MNYITLTNAAEAHRGNKISINTLIIATVHNAGEEGTSEAKTFVFCPPHGTWEVEESLEYVVEKLNESRF